MKAILILALAGWMALTGGARAQEIPADMELFLLIGQSNMAGRGTVEPQDELPTPHVFMLTKDLQWVPARDPVHFDKKAAGVGLCSQFARTLIKQDSKLNIGLIPCAVGGTSLDQWKAGGQLYQNAITRAREAMKHGHLAGILWHQGESDSAEPKVATYGARLAVMIAKLRKDLGAENVPLVIGELGRFRAKEASVKFNAALPDVARGVPLCAMVGSEGLTDRGDKLHFDSASLRTLGERYAAAYLKLKSDSHR